MGEFLDLARWNRREHFELFRDAVQPFFSVTVEADVTALWRFCREGNASFFPAAIYLLLRALDANEAMKLRIREEGVWKHDRIGVGTTIMREDETFAFARFDLMETYAAFAEAAEKTIARARESRSLDPHDGQDDLIYHSTLPWFRFTAFTNAIARADSNPRVTFGRVVDDGDACRMPVTVEVHHALVDGLHVARFVEQFESELRDFRNVVR